MTAPPIQTVYRRPLPERHVAFSSEAGKALFKEALAQGTLESYFPLAEQHHTQSDPAFCGLGALVVALNALGIDPGRQWKGPWRWFSEELLDCCMSHDQVRERGVTLDQLACLGLCNGALARVIRAETLTLETLRELVDQRSRATGTVLIASYDRGVLGQTGAGHFSPLGGYHRESDRVLVLDVARFKYPAHWVTLSELLDAMRTIDPVTNQSRGLLSLRAREVGDGPGFWGGANAELAQRLATEVRAALAGEKVVTVTEALSVTSNAVNRVMLGGAGAEAFSTGAFDSLLEPFASGRLFGRLRQLPAALPTALTTALVYLLPPGIWDELARPLADELRSLCQGEELPVETLRELRSWRLRSGQTAQCAQSVEKPPGQ